MYLFGDHVAFETVAFASGTERRLRLMYLSRDLSSLSTSEQHVSLSFHVADLLGGLNALLVRAEEDVSLDFWMVCESLC